VTIGEYIELHNIGSEVVDLVDWQLGDSSSARYIIAAADFTSTVVTAGGYLAIYRDKSKIVLNNGGDTVKLYQPDGTLLDSVIYSESAEDDVSYNFTDESWQWSTQLTPGAANQVTPPNDPPQADAGNNQSVLVGTTVKFTSADSSDPNGDTLICSWNFGDESSGSGCSPTHAYNIAGIYTATLTVSDGRGGSDTDTIKITVSESSESDDSDGQDDGTKQDPENPSGPFSKDIIVTEFLPNPEGSDTVTQGEFIELYNRSSKIVDLSAWQLDDEEGGSSPYTIPDDTTIKSQEYLAFYRGDTKISINNSGDSVRLLHPDGQVTAEVIYEGKAEDGEAYGLNDAGEWQWTTNPTPGKANSIQEPIQDDQEESDSEDSDTSTDSSNSTSTKKSEKITSPDKSDSVQELTIKQAKSQKKNTAVVVKGVINVPPKILSDTYFYLQDTTGGIQIYFSKKDFPELKLGVEVKVTGKVSEKSGEKKINIKDKKDIEVLAQKDPPQPSLVKTGRVKNPFVGQLVLATGQIVKLSGNTFYIDDGSGELKISIKKSTEIQKPEWKKGDWVTIIGIVGKTSSGLRVMLRYQEDLKLGKYEGGSEDTLPAAGNGGSWLSFVINSSYQKLIQYLRL